MLGGVRLGAALVTISLIVGPLATGDVVAGSDPPEPGDLSTQIITRKNPLNHAPTAQAGPPIIVMDGGPNDEDGETDGQASIRLWGDRSSDTDGNAASNQHLPCTIFDPYRPVEPLDFEWHQGELEAVDSTTSIATGETVILPQRDFGFREYTLQVEDPCGRTDLDHHQAFVGTSQTQIAHWTLNTPESSPVTTTGIAHTTDACNVDADGAYLAFNLGRNDTGACHYQAQNPVQGRATFTIHPGDAEILALEFDTRFDTRDGVGSLQEELFGNIVEDTLTVQASFDQGQTWTKANHTFSYQRLDADLPREWHRAGGIYNLAERDAVGDPVQFRFAFDSVTAVDGGGYGWLVNNVRLTALER